MKRVGLEFTKPTLLINLEQRAFVFVRDAEKFFILSVCNYRLKGKNKNYLTFKCIHIQKISHKSRNFYKIEQDIMLDDYTNSGIIDPYLGTERKKRSKPL